MRRGERPARAAERAVGEAERAALELDRDEAALATQHPTHDRLERGDAPGSRLLEQRRSRLHAPAVLRDRDHDAASREHEPEAVPAELDRLDDGVEPGQPNVRGDDALPRPAGPAEGDRVGHHRHLAPALVAVGLGPPGLALLQRHIEPVALPVAVRVAREVGFFERCLALRLPVVVERAVLAARTGQPGDRGAVEVAVALDEGTQQPVGVGRRRVQHGQRLAEGQRPLLDRVQQVVDAVRRRLGLVDRLALGGFDRQPPRERVGDRQRRHVDRAGGDERPDDQPGREAAESARSVCRAHVC